MFAVRVHEGASLVYENVPDPVPNPGEVVVELKTAALNRRGVFPFPHLRSSARHLVVG